MFELSRNIEQLAKLKCNYKKTRIASFSENYHEASTQSVLRNKSNYKKKIEMGINAIYSSISYRDCKTLV